MSEKFEFIDAERAATYEAAEAPTVSRMCALLEVSKSGYYEWRHRPVSATQQRRELLADKIDALFDAFNATYGYRCIHAELLRAGELVGPELVRRIMGVMRLITVQPRPFRTTTEPDPSAPSTVDLVRRDFSAAQPGPKSSATSRTSEHGRAGCICADRLRYPRSDRVRDGRAHAHRTGA